MKTMIFAFAVCILLSVIADVGLDQLGFSSEEQQSAASVRLD